MKINNKINEFLSLGVLHFTNIKVKDEKKLIQFIDNEVIRIKELFAKDLPEGYSDSRKLYRAFKIDPTKYRPSSEALWRRVKRGLDFPNINPFVDMINYLSLKHQTSYGLYDTDKINGNIIADIGSEEDSYEGIRKDRINLKGKLHLRDDKGAFGNPSSDSIRTSTDKDTKNLLAVIFFYRESNLKKDVLENSLENFLNFFDFSSYLNYEIIADEILELI